jgi:membrane protein
MGASAGPSPSRETAADRLRSMLARASETAGAIPGVRRVLAELVRVEFIDRSLVVAAQSLFALIPLLVVVAAFTPNVVEDSVLDQVTDVMAIEDAGLAFMEQSVSSEQVRTQTGLAGVLLVVVSATSFARSMQRLFEKIWERPHLGGISGARVSLLWIAGCVAYLQILAVALGSFTTIPGAPIWRLCSQVVASTLLWWWSAYVLLQRREPWSALLPGAVLAAVGLAVLTRASQVLMPPYVTSSVNQFGPLGVIFAASTWLLCFGGILVVSGVLGRVLSDQPLVHRLTTYARQKGSGFTRRG